MHVFPPADPPQFDEHLQCMCRFHHAPAHPRQGPQRVTGVTSNDSAARWVAGADQEGPGQQAEAKSPAAVWQQLELQQRQQKQRRRQADSTDWFASTLTRRFGLAGGLAWLGFLSFGVISEQVWQTYYFYTRLGCAPALGSDADCQASARHRLLLPADQDAAGGGSR